MAEDQTTGKPEGKRRPQVRLSDRLALRPAEVAQVLGLSERSVRQLLPELPVVRVGTAALIPVEQLREWLRDRARVAEKDLDDVADAILQSFDGDDDI